MIIANSANAAWIIGCALMKGIGQTALVVIGAAGYDGLAAVQSASALTAIKQLYLIWPIPFLVLSIIFYALYKLDKTYPKVMEDLEKRESGQNQ